VFTWLNKQGVQSERGFVVQRTGRFTAEYSDGAKVVTLDVESGLTDGGLPCLIVDPTAFDRWDNGEQIAPAQRSELFENLKQAIEFQGLKLLVQAAEPPR
jgi:hypothetical protein